MERARERKKNEREKNGGVCKKEKKLKIKPKKTFSLSLYFTCSPSKSARRPRR